MGTKKSNSKLLKYKLNTNKLIYSLNKKRCLKINLKLFNVFKIH